jgi:hypothetical protein
MTPEDYEVWKEHLECHRQLQRAVIKLQRRVLKLEAKK